MLDRRETEWKHIPTFSRSGAEYVVELREGVWDGWLWFPQHFAVDLLIDRTKISGVGRRYALTVLSPLAKDSKLNTIWI